MNNKYNDKENFYFILINNNNNTLEKDKLNSDIDFEINIKMDKTEIIEDINKKIW